MLENQTRVQSDIRYLFPITSHILIVLDLGTIICYLYVLFDRTISDLSMSMLNSMSNLIKIGICFQIVLNMYTLFHHDFQNSLFN